MVAYLGGNHHMIDKTDTTCHQVNLGMEAHLGGIHFVVLFLSLSRSLALPLFRSLGLSQAFTLSLSISNACKRG